MLFLGQMGWLVNSQLPNDIPSFDSLIVRHLHCPLAVRMTPANGNLDNQFSGIVVVTVEREEFPP